MKNLSDIEDLIQSNYWLNNINQIKGITSKYNPNKKDFQRLFFLIKTYILKGNKGRALNWFLLGLIVNQDKVLREIKREGLLKASNFSYNSSIIKFLTSKVLSKNNEIPLNENSYSYLSSINNLLSITPDIKKINLDIKKYLKKNKKTIFKDLLAIIEVFFMKNFQSLQRTDSSELSFYTVEEIAESISYLFYLYDSIIKLNHSNLNLMNENAVINTSHFEIIINACKIKKYNEFEVLIDSFGYFCTTENKTFKIFSPIEQLEKSIQYGWIYNYMQRNNFILSLSSSIADKTLSFEKIIKDAYNFLKDKVIILKKSQLKGL